MIGREVGNYRIVSLLGEGGMGEVYLAEHPTIDRKVAVKVLRSDLAANESVVARFVNEARVASTLRHPNVIEVLDTGRLEPDHMPYMLMELLEGESLADRIARVGVIDQNDVLEWTYQTAAALGAAHAKNIVHRDLKPPNLFLVADDRIPGRERIKVLDFGIAKVMGGVNGAGLQRTRTGMLMGTPLYMSPEQCRGAKEIDTRSDIYSLGLIMYEMLCGAPPFVSQGFAELISMHLMRPPLPPRAHNPTISEEVEQVILRALAKEPDNRFATVQDLQRALGYEPSRPTTSGRVSAGLGAAPKRPSGPLPTLAAPQSIISATAPSASSATAPSASSATAPSASSAAAPSASSATAPSASSAAAPTVSHAAPAIPRRTPLPPTRATPEETRGPARPPTGEVSVAAPSRRTGILIAAAIALVGSAAAIGVLSQRKSEPPARTALDEAWDLSHRADSYSFPGNDYVHACPLWVESCDRQNNDYGCLRAGLCYEQALGGVKKDRDRSCAFYAKGCSPASKEASSCDNLAECYDATLQDPSAQKLFCDASEAHCDKGSASACASAGACYAHGAGGRTRTPARGCDLWQKACDGGLADACESLGGCFASGDGRDHDPARALALFQKACEHGTRMAREGCAAADKLHNEQAASRKRHAEAVAQETQQMQRMQVLRKEPQAAPGKTEARRPRPRPAPAPQAPEDDDIPVR